LKPVNLHTADEIRGALDLDPATGILTWKNPSVHNPYLLGRVFGNIRPDGYLGGRVFGKAYLVHRLVWLHFYGEWPAGELDHIDLDKTNNRISNLREATRSDNIHNTNARKHNKLGVKGIYERQYASGKRYRASIHENGKRRDLGAFLTLLEAKAAYEEAARRAYGSFAGSLARQIRA
jgi:hypothetical protein